MTSTNTDNITTESDKIPLATPGDRRDPLELAGMPGRIAKFADAVTLTDSIITENAGRLGVGTAPSTAILTVTSAAAASPAISARNTAPGGVGVSSDSPSGNAVLGVSQSGNGVFGKSPDGLGVAGQSTSGTGVFGTSDSGAGVKGVSTNNVGVEAVSTNSAGVVATSTNSTAVAATSPNGFGVRAQSVTQTGVFSSSTTGTGVTGVSTTDIGVEGSSADSAGVFGESAHSDAVVGVSRSNGHAAVAGINKGRGFGVYGESEGGGFAGYFAGNVHVFGTLSKGGGGFTIDHPLDPMHKTLTHSFVESPDMMNLYNGNTITDAQGNATITLPAYFQALNGEFRYQLTVLEQFAQAMVSREIQENAFTIKTDKPHVKVSWLVTGVRQDAFANAHRLTVEDDKPAQEQGTYLYPVEHGQPKTQGVAQPRQLGERPPMNADVAWQRCSTQL